MPNEVPEDERKELGKAFAVRRKAMGLTQQTCAESLDVTRETVGEWERGGRGIPKIAWLALDGLEARFVSNWKSQHKER